jgi:ribose transport system substrate-binding protein
MTEAVLRRIALFAVLVGALALAGVAAGCGGDDGANGQQADTQEQAEEQEGGMIAVVAGVRAEPFHNAMSCGAREEAERLGYEIDIQAPERWDATLQIPIMNGVVARNPDAIILVPNDAAALVPAAREAHEQGITIVTADQDLEDDSLRVSFVASNNVAGGEAAAEALAEAIDEQGKVMIMNNVPGATTPQQRQEGFERGIEKYENIEYLGVRWSPEISAERAAAEVGAMLRQHPDLRGVFAVNDGMAQGAATAIREAGKTEDVVLVAFDAATIQMELMRRGELAAAVGQRPREVGRLAVQQAVNALRGDDVQGTIETEFTIVTPDNMDDEETQDAIYTQLDC